MPAVTQLTPNFLGGVSTQTDDKKLENQVKECINGYPDPTFGLLKRPGMKFTNVLKKDNGDAFTKSELEDAAWFFIDRAAAGSYIGAIKGSNLYVWTAEDGTWCTVTNNGGSYLTGTKQSDYHFRSIQDTTVITNKTVTTAMQADGSYTANAVGTIKLLGIDDSNYTVTLQGDDITFSPQSTETFDDMLLYDASSINTNHHMVDAIVAYIQARQSASDPDFTGRWYIEGYTNSLVIRYTDEATGIVTDYSTPGGNPQAFTISARGGTGNSFIEAFQDDVIDISKVPAESFDGHNLKILNSSTTDDDYYVKFTAYNGTGGAGYWGETVARDVSPGLDATTMPHILSNTGATSFTFDEITYKGREAGDNNTNPEPSFIGNTISSTFYYSNRFGVLSADNVILGVANDAFNFFSKSALTQIASDPIDLNVSSVRPVTLSDVLPSPQGLLLFSERQQFQVYATDASILTPTSAVIRTLSNYEMATDIAPVDVGTTSAFISRVPGYSKLFTMVLRDVEQSPIVVDISKAVLEWIPDTVDGLTTSPPNSIVMLVDRDTSYLYLYRYYNNGKEDLFQAWTKWELPGTIQSAKIINDNVVTVSQHEDEYTIGTLALDEMPSGNVIATSTSFTGNPSLDMATRPVSPDGGVTDAVVYDSTNDITKLYVPFTPIEDREGAMLLTLPTADVGTDADIDSDQGYWAVATERTEIGTGYRYFEVKGDFSGYADGIVVGYNYDMEVTLPRFYFRRNEVTTDYTATLVISRAKFAIGRTGAVQFKIKAEGSNEWKPVQHTAEADLYAGDTNPVLLEKTFTVPIHQRNTNFELKVTSNFPYPVSLVSMMWEGNYSPRFYRRT
jgi:hypothetical protein